MKTRTRIHRERVQDPETGEISWEFREIKKTSLEEEDRMLFVSQILRGERTPEEIRRNYGIVSINSIYTWIGKYVTLQALRMALETIDDDTASRLIHHSDRGCQYCSAAYVAELKKHNRMISMTQSSDPLENAIAERANGILKTEWLYKMKIPAIEKWSLFQCDAEAYCLRVAPRQSPLPLRLPKVKLQRNPQQALHCRGILLNLHSEDDDGTSTPFCRRCKATQFTELNRS